MDWIQGLCTPTRPDQNPHSGGGANRPGRDAEGGKKVGEWMMCCDPRGPNDGPGGSSGFMSPSFTNPEPKGERAGVGIILALNPDSSLYVHTVCPGSSAEHYLFPGDVLMRIGKEDVYRAPAPFVAELLLGPPGSELEAWVRRQNPNGDPPYTTHCVKMVRRRTDPEMARKSIKEAFEDKSPAKTPGSQPGSARGVPNSARSSRASG